MKVVMYADDTVIYVADKRKEKVINNCWKKTWKELRCISTQMN